MKPQRIKLHPEYVTGLTEGEGCFHISFSYRKKLKVGIETRPSFSITLNRRDLMLLQGVHQYFDCGTVRYSQGDRTYKYETRSVAELVDRVIPHFETHPLRGDKQNDFTRFALICRRVRANQHLNGKQLRSIIESAYAMNPSGKRKHGKEELLRALDKLKV